MNKKAIKTCTEIRVHETEPNIETVSKYINPSLMPDKEKNICYSSTDGRDPLYDTLDIVRIPYDSNCISAYDCFVNVNTSTGIPVSFEQHLYSDKSSDISDDDEKTTIISRDRYNDVLSETTIFKNKNIITVTVNEYNEIHRIIKKDTTYFTKKNYIVFRTELDEYTYNDDGFIESAVHIDCENGVETKYIDEYIYSLYDSNCCRGLRDSNDECLSFLIKEKIETRTNINSDNTRANIEYNKISRYNNDADNTILEEDITKYNDNGDQIAHIVKVYNDGLVEKEVDVMSNTTIKTYEYTFYEE